ncbi:MAG: OmpH family outer membrane protein [Gammaproteobacteria bacterium]|nr:OmpH family outer membrane protein [Gammaproteobacteria bacterium]
MKVSKSTIAAFALATVCWALPGFAQTRIGVVDYSRLLEESPQAKAVSEAMRNEFAPRTRELQAQQQTLKTKEEKFNKDAATMSADQRSRSEKELRDGARDFARRQSELQDDINARRNEELSRLQRTLIEEVRTYAKAQSFDLVLADGVIFATNALDITPAVLTALQARNGRPAAAAPAPAAQPKPAAGGR